MRITVGRKASLFVASIAAVCDAQQYEGYYLYLGNRPAEGNPGWHEDAQGLAHDADHWFITQQRVIWKVPVGQDLAENAYGAPGVIRRTLSDYSELGAYNHFGDLVYFNYEGTGYLLVPLEGADTFPSLAVFLASDLTYVDRVWLAVQNFGWCAVTPSGDIYTSHNFASSFLRYTIDWELLRTSGALELTSGPVEFPFYDTLGEPLQLRYSQGGEFSTSGELLYFVTGYYTDTDDFSEGLHVFDTSTWRRVQHSTNGYGHFNYEFHTGFDTYEEPEGLTVWDLDEGRAPHVRGQLHVMMLDNDELSGDDIYVKHYTHVIWVDSLNPTFEDGTPQFPFRTIGAALKLAWSGSEIRIRAGRYAEAMRVSRHVRLTSEGGVTRIGG